MRFIAYQGYFLGFKESFWPQGGSFSGFANESDKPGPVNVSQVCSRKLLYSRPSKGLEQARHKKGLRACRHLQH